MFGTKSRREHFIAGHEFSPALIERVGSEHPEIGAQHLGLVFEGLRQWFQICRLSGEHFVSMPSAAVDEAWHEFILFTRDYDAFCRQALGRFLHHTPNAGLSAERAGATIERGFARAWELACRSEGMDPRSAERLPLIFSVDTQVGIDGGFHYDLNAVRSEWAERRGNRWWPVGAPGGTAPVAAVAGCAGVAGVGGAGGSRDGGGGGAGDGGGGCGGGCGGG